VFETLLASPIKLSQAMQYRGTADDERKLFVQIEQLQQAREASKETRPATVT